MDPLIAHGQSERLAAAWSRVDPATETTLTAVDTVLDNIKLDTAGIANLALESTLSGIKTTTDQLDIDANGSLETKLMTDAGATLIGQQLMAASLPVAIASDQTPVPVNLAEKTSIINYYTQAAVAVDATQTFELTAPANYILDKIDASASGQIRVEILWGADGAEATKAVKFSSKGDLNVVYNPDQAVQIASTQNIQVKITNMDNQAQDVYATIECHAA